MRDRDRQKGKSQIEGLPPRKRLEIYRKEYYKMMKKEHAAHGADVGLPGQDYRYMDNLKQKIRKLEKELNVEKPPPIVIPQPPKAKIEAIKAKLRKQGFRV